MTQTTPLKPGRSFSKRILLLNVVLAWVAVFFAIPYEQAEFVVGAALTMIGAIYGAYTGIGHLDLRRMIALKEFELNEPDESS